MENISTREILLALTLLWIWQRVELSFVLDGANLGVACEEVPFDKLFVPYVIMDYYKDSINL